MSAVNCWDERKNHIPDHMNVHITHTPHPKSSTLKPDRTLPTERASATKYRPSPQ
ncbi:MAG: hypothetical protein AAFV98_11210 [Chloroflexota bacterium]